MPLKSVPRDRRRTFRAADTGFGVLSNMYPCLLNVGNRPFQSLEHAYQYFKCKYMSLDSLATRVRNAETAFAAKALTRRITADRMKEWQDDERRGALPTMMSLLMVKYTQVEDFRWLMDMCVQFWEVPIEATRSRFWGAGLYTREQVRRYPWTLIPGRNYLGKLMMLLLCEAWGLQDSSPVVWNNGNWGITYVEEYPDEYDPGHDYYRNRPPPPGVQRREPGEAARRWIAGRGDEGEFGN